MRITDQHFIQGPNLLWLLLIFVFNISPLQAQEVGYALDNASLRRYNLHIIKHLENTVTKAILDDQLMAYKDLQLKRTYATSELDQLLTTCEVISVQTDPNDPYATKDSLLCGYMGETTTYDISLFPSKKNCCTVNFKKYIDDHRTKEFYIDFNELLNHLQPKEKRFLKVAHQFIFLEPSGTPLLPDWVLEEDILRHFYGVIDSAIVMGKLNVYDNSVAEDAIDSLELWKRMHHVILNQYQIGDDIYNVKDSIRYVPITYIDLTGFRLIDHVLSDSGKLILELSEVEPAFRVTKGRFTDSFYPVYSLKWTDLKPLISEDAASYLLDVLNYMRLKRMNAYDR